MAAPSVPHNGKPRRKECVRGGRPRRLVTALRFPNQPGRLPRKARQRERTPRVLFPTLLVSLSLLSKGTRIVFWQNRQNGASAGLSGKALREKFGRGRSVRSAASRLLIPQNRHRLADSTSCLLDETIHNVRPPSGLRSLRAAREPDWPRAPQRTTLSRRDNRS